MLFAGGKTRYGTTCRSMTASWKYPGDLTGRARGRTGPCTLPPWTCSRTVLSCGAANGSNCRPPTGHCWRPRSAGPRRPPRPPTHLLRRTARCPTRGRRRVTRWWRPRLRSANTRCRRRRCHRRLRRCRCRFCHRNRRPSSLPPPRLPRPWSRRLTITGTSPNRSPSRASSLLVADAIRTTCRGRQRRRRRVPHRPASVRIAGTRRPCVCRPRRTSARPTTVVPETWTAAGTTGTPRCTQPPCKTCSNNSRSPRPPRPPQRPTYSPGRPLRCRRSSMCRAITRQRCRRSRSWSTSQTYTTAVRQVYIFRS